MAYDDGFGNARSSNSSNSEIMNIAERYMHEAEIRGAAQFADFLTQVFDHEDVRNSSVTTDSVITVIAHALDKYEINVRRKMK